MQFEFPSIFNYKYGCAGVYVLGRRKRQNLGPVSSVFAFYFFLIYLFAPGLSCGTWDLQSLLQHVGSLIVHVVSSSLTRDGTWALCIENLES